MKMIRKTEMMLLLLACMLLFVPGAVHAAEADVAGRYDAIECSQGDTYYECDGEYLVLNEDGKGEIQFSGTVYSLTWEIDGTQLSITDEDGENVTGTLEDGVINLDYLDYQYVYVRNDSSVGGSFDAAPSGDASDQAPASDDVQKETQSQEVLQTEEADQTQYTQEGPQVYLVKDRTDTGSGDGDSEGDPTWRMDYIALNEDGTGTFLFNKALFVIRWKQDGNQFSFTDHLGQSFTGTIDSGTITGTYSRYRYTFERGGSTLPVYTLSPSDWGHGLAPVVDEADVLSDAQEAEYTAKAKELAEQYDVGVYVIIVGSRDAYTRSNDISVLGEELYAGYALGVGPTEKKEKHGNKHTEDWKDAIVLTVAVSERKYDIYVAGDYANWAIPTYGREQIEEHVVDELKENRWSGSVEQYLGSVEKVLKIAAKGKQISFKNDTTGRMVGLFVPLILALLFGYGIAAVMRSSMQNTQRAKNAAAYVASDKVDFTRREDRYIRTLVSRVYSPKEKSSSGSGGSFSSSSGGSHSSGSF